MNNKSIVIINNGLGMGGIQKASTFLANVFADLGHEVIVLALYKTDKLFFYLNEKVKFIEPSFDRSAYSPWLYVIKMMLYIRRNVKKINPDVVMAFGEWTNSFVILSTRQLSIPVFLSDRMSPTLSLGRIQNSLKKQTYPFATGIIAQTSYAKHILSEKTKNRNIEVIPNPVNAIDVTECPKKNQVITIGRLTKEKGHTYLIEAFSKIKNKEWQLLIVGDGKERESLERKCTELGLQNRVIFAGEQKDLTKFLSESKIFILPSLSEGFPNALIEAMSVPRACISTDCIAGPRDIIEDGVNGMLIEPANSDSMAKAIDTLIEDENLRNSIAKNAFKIRENLNIDVIAKRYLDFITK